MDKARDIVERLRDIGCDRPPFTAEHAECVCRTADAAAADIESLRSALKAEQEKEFKTSAGHGKPCFYCHEPCDSLAGNPGKWPVGFCHVGAHGSISWHHASCLAAEQEKGERLREALEQPDGDALAAGMLQLRGMLSRMMMGTAEQGEAECIQGLIAIWRTMVRASMRAHALDGPLAAFTQGKDGGE